MKTHIIKGRITAEKIIVRLLSSWCFANGFLAVIINISPGEKAYLENMNVFFTLFVTVVMFAFLSLIMYFFQKSKKVRADVQSIILLIAVMFYGVVSSCFENDGYFCIGISAAAVISVFYFVCKNPLLFSGKDLTGKGMRACVSVAFVISFFFVAMIGLFRYLTFSTPNFDFGIFAQSLDSMKTKLIPYNTSERDMLMSHFRVHISPVLYLVLPLCYIMPVPAALQISQAIAVTLTVIPLCLICKNHSLSKKVTLLMALLCLFYPALTTGTFYDFHENAFLTVFIMWFLYFMEKGKNIPMLIFAVLTLLVKEDAMIYLAFIGLYMLFLDREKRIKGIFVIIISGTYFTICLWILNKYGMGAMTDRFMDYMTEEKLGLIGVVFNLIKSPAYVIKNCFTSDKLLFILECLLPLGFMPFITKKFSRYILIFPFILMNLMPSYGYQHSIDFQYVYGVMALFMYLSVINLSDFTPSLKRKILPSALAVTALFYSGLVMPKISYVGEYFSHREEFEKIRQVLSVIPEDGEVISSTFFVAELSDRKTVYQIDYTEHSAKYVALDLRYKTDKGYSEIYDLSEYECIKREEGLAAVYKKIE